MLFFWKSWQIGIEKSNFSCKARKNAEKGRKINIFNKSVDNRRIVEYDSVKENDCFYKAAMTNCRKKSILLKSKGGTIMKKAFLKIAALSLALVLCVASLALAEAPDASKMDPIELTFSTMSVGSSTNVQAGIMVNMMLRELPEGSVINITTELAGTAIAPFMLSSGLCDLTQGDATPTVWAEQGVTPGREGQVATNVAALGGCDAFSSVLVILSEEFVAKTGYTTLEEAIEAKYPLRFATKTNGSFGEMTCKMILSTFGLTYSDIESWGGSVTCIEQSQAIDLMKDGRADVYIDHNNMNNANITELCMTKDVVFAQLSEKTLEGLFAIGYAPHTIAAESFSGKPATDVQNAACCGNFLVRADLPDDYAYLLTKALCENVEEMRTLNANFEMFEPANGWKQELTGCALHPGALKYYQDAGYIQE